MIGCLDKINVLYNHVKYSDIGDINLEKFDHFILSGRVGGGAMVDRNNLKVLRHAISGQKPLLGVCYGAHIMALLYECTLNRLDDLKTGNYSIRIIKDNPLWNDKINNAFFSHRYVITKLTKDVESIAISDEGYHDIIRIKDLPIFGIQFHPEKMDVGGLIINSFVNI